MAESMIRNSLVTCPDCKTLHSVQVRVDGPSIAMVTEDECTGIPDETITELPCKRCGRRLAVYGELYVPLKNMDKTDLKCPGCNHKHTYYLYPVNGGRHCFYCNTCGKYPYVEAEDIADVRKIP